MAYTKRDQKETFVKDYGKKLKEKGDFILADFRGMNAAEMTALRRKVRESSFECKVVKNTLMRKVMDELKVSGIGDFVTGPLAMISGKGELNVGAKTLVNFSKEHENLKIKVGLLGGRMINTAQVKELALLPSREVLIAKVAGALNGPVTKLACGLKGIISGIAIALEGVRKKKEESK